MPCRFPRRVFSFHPMNTFEEMFSAARPQLWLYALKLADNRREEAEDLLGEATAKAWENRREYRGVQPFANWVTRILTNLGTDELRVKAMLPESVSLDHRSKHGESLADVEDVRAEFSGCFEVLDVIERLPELHRVEIVAILEGQGDGSLGERCRRTRARQALGKALGFEY